MHHGIVSLWSLLEACRAGNVDEIGAAARDAEAAIRASTVPWLELALDDGALSVDGAFGARGVDTFAATHGLAAFLRDAAITAVRFGRDVRAAGLAEWGRHVAARTSPPQWPAGVDVTSRDDRVEDAEPLRRVQRGAAVGEQADSRLRSVFLQHRLIAGLPALPGVDPQTAKLVVQGVVDRLLQVPGGLEPLILLQQDEALLRRSTAVAVRTVLYARAAGWPTSRLADLGAAGLLHDVGAVLDAEDPAAAGFRWLLERGADDFWLRSALVCRRWRGENPVGADDGLCAAGLVRLASAAADGADPARVVGVPAELAAVAGSV